MRKMGKKVFKINRISLKSSIIVDIKKNIEKLLMWKYVGMSASFCRSILYWNIHE